MGLKQVTVLLALIGVIVFVGCITPETEYPEAKAQLTIEEAMAIAQDSECVREGWLSESYVYNANTGTWWIDLDPYTEIEGCNPACVVFEDTKTAKIYWRCTGDYTDL
jgi:hypothetical protein